MAEKNKACSTSQALRLNHACTLCVCVRAQLIGEQLSFRQLRLSIICVEGGDFIIQIYISPLLESASSTQASFDNCSQGHINLKALCITALQKKKAGISSLSPSFFFGSQIWLRIR